MFNRFAFNENFMIYGISLLFLLAGCVAIRVVLTGLNRFFSKKKYWPADLDLFRQLNPVAQLLFFFIWGWIVSSQLAVLKNQTWIEAAFRLLTIICITWLLTRVIGLAKLLILGHFDLNVKNNLRSRKMHTQINFVERTIDVLIWIIGIGIALMTLEQVRAVGGSLLASAGVASVVIGFAAQRSISNFIAGLQIAFTQPLRVDDVVIVENEWGRIEEITLTYVVVRIWDLRRLIVPIHYFLEKPFQNWTRRSSDILCYVMLYLDYGVPLKSLREEFERILSQNAHWDRKVSVLQVTDCSEYGIQVRALMSSFDASSAWDLKCEIREALVTYIQQNFPSSLPRRRWQNIKSNEMIE